MEAFTNLKRKQSDLFRLQSNIIIDLFGTQKATDEEEKDPCVWKILIFDDFCQSLLSTLFKKGHFCEQNITLFLNLHKKRDQIFGINIIYFVQPTQQNIDKIIEDFKLDLYDSVYINFSYAIPQPLFQKLAIEIGKLNGTNKVKRVMQCPINFVTINYNLFSLNLKGVYSAFQQDQSQNHKLYEQIAISLFSLFRTLKQTPIIYYSQEKVHYLKIVKELEKIFEDQYLNSKEYEDESGDIMQSNNQPAFIFIDRDQDFGAPLLHSWIYASMIHDIIRINNNSVELINDSANHNPKDLKNYTCDLDPQRDKYWSEKMNQPFPYVNEYIRGELQNLEQEKNDIDQQKSDKNSETQSLNLTSVMEKVPEFTEKKKRLNWHMDLLLLLAKHLSERQLDKFFELESDLIFNSRLNSEGEQQLEQMLVEQAGTEEDQLRLLLVYILFNKNTRPDDLLKLESKCKIKQPHLKKILDKFKSKYNLLVQKGQEKQQQEQNLIGGFAKLASNLKNKGKDVFHNVKSYLPGDQQFKVTKTISTFIETKGNNLIEAGYQIYDPLAKKDNSLKSKNYNDIYVFIPEGCSYCEYQDLSYLSQKSQKNIFLGASEIINAQDLINEFAKLFN